MPTHFLGKVPYEGYKLVLQVSAAHVYLTYPFVLSWSMLEAMATGCLVIGSDTAPVREVLQGGLNGELVDPFDTAEAARQLVQALNAPPRVFQSTRETARLHAGLYSNSAGTLALTSTCLLSTQPASSLAQAMRQQTTPCVRMAEGVVGNGSGDKRVLIDQGVMA